MNAKPLELWGGVECTVNRVGDRFFDQMERNGHAWRDSDLDRFAALGLKALRYPLLWERLAPDHPLVTDWSWADRRLNRLRELGIRPIIGLVHHGSGPRRTHLLDPSFVEGLAGFARQVAERFPWIEDYTPVNEPLTTARFSALYGHWYPHAHDPRSFARAFFNQCQAVALSMQAIRSVNPAARLVQTEDLGKTYSTAALADQATFENHRRWLTFDLLAGHLDQRRPMWTYLQEVGLSSRELGWFLDHPCPPDILGINHYVTSERFLDERLERYPAYAHAGSHAAAYADMPAVRASAQGVSGPGRLLREAWQRYRLPLVITEAQLNCTREEQMRWFAEIWRDARALRQQEGVDVRAVTLWALLGAFNWTNLLTRDDPDSYEPGAFDLRASGPRPTALATLARTLARDGDTDHPVLRVPGWWKRPERFACEPADACQPLGPAILQTKGVIDPAPSPLLVIGADDALAHAFKVICRDRALPLELFDPCHLDGSDLEATRWLLDSKVPWAVVHSPAKVERLAAGLDLGPNPTKTGITSQFLAQACAERGIPILILSSDQRSNEQDQSLIDKENLHQSAAAAGSEVQAEGLARAVHPLALEVHIDVRFGPWDDDDLVWAAVRALALGEASGLPTDRSFTLTYLPDLVKVCLDLLLDGETGVWDLANVNALDQRMFNACASEITSHAVKVAAGELLEDAAPLLLSASVGEQPDTLLPSWQSALRHLIQVRMPVPVAC